eukprot:4343462-Lingulodinium_polyedra.AAC.1
MPSVRRDTLVFPESSAGQRATREPTGWFDDWNCVRVGTKGVYNMLKELIEYVSHYDVGISTDKTAFVSPYDHDDAQWCID